jgi:quinol monooxygenase YgiN
MPIISVFSITVRDGEIRRYEELVAELAAEARKKKEAWRWTAHEVKFGLLTRRYYVSQHEDFADLEKKGDPQGLFTRVLGEKKGQKVLEEVNEREVSTERTLGLHRPDLSYSPDQDQQIPQVSSLAVVRARPGHQQAVEAMIAKFAEAIPKTDESANLTAFQALTGDMLVYWISRRLNRLADLDHQTIGRDLLIKAFGPSEGDRIFQSSLQGIEQLQREITVYREDLSNPPR